MKAPDLKEIENQVVGRSELAHYLDMTDRNINVLAREGILKKKKAGQYLLAPSIIGYVRFLKKGNDPDNESGSESRRSIAETRAKEAIASREERKNAAAEGELVLMENLDTVLLDFGRQINKYIAALPLRIKRRYPEYAKLTNEGQTRLHTMVEEEIRKHMNLMPDVVKLRPAELIIDEDELAKLDQELAKAVDSSIRS